MENAFRKKEYPLKDTEPREIDIYTDGGCSGNPGIGGWAYVIVANGRQESEYGSDPATTNNRMELTAVIRALRRVEERDTDAARPSINLHTDSQYVRNGITSWIRTWVRNGWRTSGKDPVKNRDLWEELLQRSERFDIRYTWVRGHAGDPLNETCDALVQQAIREQRTRTAAG